MAITLEAHKNSSFLNMVSKLTMIDIVVNVKFEDLGKTKEKWWTFYIMQAGSSIAQLKNYRKKKGSLVKWALHSTNLIGNQGRNSRQTKPYLEV